MLIDIIIITYNRIEHVDALLHSIKNNYQHINKIIIVDNNSKSDINNKLQQFKLTYKKLELYTLDKNYGVSYARNEAALKSKADLLMFLDDDLVIQDVNLINKIDDLFNRDSKIAVVAFKLINYYSHKITPYEIPVPLSMSEHSTLCSYFIGAANVIRRSVFIESGMYPENYFYGNEELDLSYRIINLGYKILYCADLIGFHKKTSQSRVSNNFAASNLFKNKILTAYKYLPIKYFFSTLLFWLIKMWYEQHSFFIPLKTIFNSYNELRTAKRQIISPVALNYLKSNFGRLLY